MVTEKSIVINLCRVLDGNLDFLSLSDTSKIWRPDLFFVGQRKEKLHGAILPNTFARIYPEGSVLMSSRQVTGTLEYKSQV